MIRRGDVAAFTTAGVAIFAFAVLLVFALFRLFGTEAELRRNEGDNMLWAISRAQSAALQLDAAVLRQVAMPEATPDISRRYNVLLSRLTLLSEGPQARYLAELGRTGTLAGHAEAVRALDADIRNLSYGDAGRAEPIHDLLTALSQELGRIANRSMVRHWNVNGARLDRQQSAIMQVIFSILAIIALGAFLSIAMLRVVAERQRAQQFLSREREAAELYRSFVALVSHQFRTPLAVIDSAMQRVLRSKGAMSSDEVARRARQVRSEVHDLTKLMEATLDLSRLDAGQIVGEIVDCDIDGLLKRVKARQLEETPDRIITIETGDEVPPSVTTDPLLAEQILANLLSNAVKYSPASEIVTVRVRTQNNQVWFSVQDHGIGIPEEEQGKLFGRFFRASTAEGVPGTGVGLSVSAQLARLIGGKLDFISSPGLGSTFTLKLPDEWTGQNLDTSHDAKA